jgi:hypothetical protein
MTEDIVACGHLLGNDHEISNYAKEVTRQRPVNSNTSHLFYFNFNNVFTHPHLGRAAVA